MDTVWTQALVEEPNGSLFDVLMLQVHVTTASAWIVLVVLAVLVAVPQFRRIPSAFGLHVLQVRRRELAAGVWISYGATLASGTYLLFQHSIYDPPVSGSDWTELEAQPYGVPYYYSLYAKIGLFLLMGVATALLARQAALAAAASEAEGGPIDMDPDYDEDEWVVGPEGDLDGELADAPEQTPTSGVAVLARRRAAAAGFPAAGLWGAVATIAVGLGAIGLCVTLIKYFHELSKAAVVYEQLRGRG